jgi:hypothetical protein
MAILNMLQKITRFRPTTRARQLAFQPSGSIYENDLTQIERRKRC